MKCYYDTEIFKNVLYKGNSLSFQMNSEEKKVKIDVYSDFSHVYSINYFNREIGIYIPECLTCVIFFEEIKKYIMLVNETDSGNVNENENENGISPVLLKQMFDSNSNTILDFVKGKELEDITFKINK